MPAPEESLARLYRQTVLEHSRQPHNLGRMAQPDHQASGDNPLCGDRITLYLREKAGCITEAAFEGTGCAISLASASMLTDLVPGRPAAEVRRLVRTIMDAFTGSNGTLPGDLAALGEVRAYPARIRCATLPWKTLDAALDDAGTPVSTE